MHPSDWLDILWDGHLARPPSGYQRLQSFRGERTKEGVSISADVPLGG
ncbi:hypothetical protein [Nodularia sphaerocarpa]|nr:hypothetical protein [Nodularia sphaerocarpa]MDB9376209.1 hypothetical protein [Nodularia sphaerocarpa CS-585]MDB9380256.1 hypothetical protein [Nodularia sphaerocarpa CS-585A2]